MTKNWDQLKSDFLSYRAGNSSVVRKLFESLSFNIQNLIALKTNNGNQGDISQQALLKIHQYRNDFDKDKSFKSWVYTIVINTITDDHRKSKHFSATSQFADQNDDTDNEYYALDLIIDEKQLSNTIHENKDFANFLIKSLSKEDATILYLYTIEELSIRELSETLGISTNNTKVKIHRLFNKIREKHGPNWKN